MAYAFEGSVFDESPTATEPDTWTPDFGGDSGIPGSEGDLLILALGIGSGIGATTTPAVSGWTAITGALDVDVFEQVSVFYKSRDATESNPTYTWSGGDDWMVAGIAAYSGIDVDSGLVGGATNYKNDRDTSAGSWSSGDTITSIGDGDVLFAICHADEAGSGETITPDSPLTSDAGTDNRTTDALYLDICSGTKSGAGSFSPTFSTSYSQMRCLWFAMSESAGGGSILLPVLNYHGG